MLYAATIFICTIGVTPCDADHALKSIPVPGNFVSPTICYQMAFPQAVKISTKEGNDKFFKIDCSPK